MPIQGEIKTLYKNKNNTSPIFPTTKVKAVSDENGIGLDALLRDNYATKTYVTSEIAKAQVGGDDSEIDLSGFATKDDVANIKHPISSVNNKTGEVVLTAEDIGARPDNWTPTAQQVGARSNTWMPSATDVGAKVAGAIEPIATGGTGAHTAELALSNLSELHINGDWQTAKLGISAWHYEVNDTKEMRSQYNIPHGGCEIIVMKKANGRGVALAFGWVNGQSHMWRNNLHDDTNSNKWTGWVDVRDAIDAAPAGYGLGTSTPTLWTNVRDITGSGWYFYNVSYSSGGPVNNTGIVHASVGHNSTRIDFYTYDNHHAVLYKMGKEDDGWGEWEWVNPPMTAGVHYRTTERYSGKAVYTTMFPFGALPNNSSAFTDGRYDAVRIIRARGIGIEGNYLSFPAKWKEGNETREINLLAATWGVSIDTNFDASYIKANIQVWYTKEY